MAVSAHIDHVSDLVCEEEHGVIVRLTRLARVIGLTSTNYEVLSAALAAAGVPVYGDSLSGTGIPSNLRLTKRSTRLVDGDKSAVDVTLVYETDTRSQVLSGPTVDFVLAELTASLNEVQATLDIDGSVVELEYTYPSAYGLNGHGDRSLAGKTVVQTGTFKRVDPRLELSFQGVKTTRDPALLANALAGKVNATTWFGAGPHEWMCMGVSIRPAKVDSTTTYEVGLRFQKNADTWDPEVFFKDEFGKRPTDLLPGTGIKRVRACEEQNFTEVIGAVLLGG